MLMKYKDLGTMLSKEEMKGVKGGKAFDQLKDFHCLMSNNGNVVTLPGGCTAVSGCASTYCIQTYPQPNYQYVGLDWYAVGCPYETACGVS